jgi:ferredoxin
MTRYQITLRDTGEFFFCADDEAVLRAMFNSGAGRLKNGCCGGGCGICRVRIVSGAWKVFKPMSSAHVKKEDIEKNIVLLCCVQPRGDLVIAGV